MTCKKRSKPEDQRPNYLNFMMMSGSLLLPYLLVSLNLTSSLALIPHAKNNNPTQKSIASSTNQLSRSVFFQWLGAGGSMTLLSPTLPAVAFEFGVLGGGLDKTQTIKPAAQTGVELWDADSTPIPNALVHVATEIVSSSGKPILVTLQSPWLLSNMNSNRGLEARDLRNSESLFVEIVPLLDPNNAYWQTPYHFRRILLESILGANGTFGVYGSSPTDVKVVALNDTTTSTLFQVTFTSSYIVTGESDLRQLWIAPKAIDKDTLVLLVVGTTRQRFVTHETAFQKVVDSFTAVEAPTTTTLMQNRKHN
jgi:hypothetical protein